MDSGSKAVALILVCLLCSLLCSPCCVALSGAATAMSLAVAGSGSSGSDSIEPASMINVPVGSAPKSSAFSSALASGPSWCREPGKTEYTGYSSKPETDMTKCQDTCIKDPKCKAFESNGDNCWYYGGAETQQPAPAGAKNQCYVKK